MSLPFFNWSRTAASNASADSTVNWAEGMAPSAVNDSARAMMASTAAFRDDISGAIVTTGTATAYAVSSNQVFDTLAHMDGALIAFTPHVTNTSSFCQLNVDGLGLRNIRIGVGSIGDMPSGSLVAGTPYLVKYDNTATVFFLMNGGFNPYGVPLGGGMPYLGATPPNSSFTFPIGQPVSRTTYSTLFTLVGTTFGAGDGSTTFNLPDFRSYTIISADNMGGSGPGRTTLAFAATAGTQTHSITQGELPAVGLSVTASGTASVSSTVGNIVQGSIVAMQNGGATPLNALANGAAQAGVNSTGTASVTGTTSNLGSGTAMSLMQPTLALNYILRIL